MDELLQGNKINFTRKFRVKLLTWLLDIYDNFWELQNRAKVCKPSQIWRAMFEGKMFAQKNELSSNCWTVLYLEIIWKIAEDAADPNYRCCHWMVILEYLGATPRKYLAKDYCAVGLSRKNLRRLLLFSHKLYAFIIV